MDARARAESIREARRKFEEKELAKEQKAQLAEVRAIEKQNLREAKQMESFQLQGQSNVVIILVMEEMWCM